MRSFNGTNKNKKYFEGWYFKHSKGNQVMALIPGINVDENGVKSAFIQVITNEQSYQITYSYKKFYASPQKFFVKIGNNVFCKKGIKLDIQEKNLSLKGTIRYGNFHKLQYDIMGPFCKIPFMECNHGVISANHHLSGKIKINDTVINFKDGNGYIEKDWGNSFPKKYAWTQCNSFEQQNISIMASAAEIPFLGLNFNGCIAFVIYGGKEYRLATYNGAKILKYTQNQIIIKNHKNFLKIDIEKGIQNQLIAPQNGGMTRKIQEQPCCNARFRFYEEGNLLFDLTGKNVGFEYVNIST